MINLKEQFKNDTDATYAKFNKKIISDTKYEFLGIRTPLLKAYAKEVAQDKNAVREFLNSSHVYYEEWLFHGLLLSYGLNFNETLKLFEEYMPNIDSWGLCDCTVAALKIFKKNKKPLFAKVKKWLKSNHVYTVRTGVVTLLDYFIEEEYLEEIIKLTENLTSKEYYINMAIAWLYSVMLIKYFSFTVKILEKKTLPKFVHNKTIQKAVESFRIPKENKEYLKTLKIK